MLEGDHAGPRRLPFSFEAKSGVGRLALEGIAVGPMIVDRLELEVTDLGTDPGTAVAEKYQRRRTRLRSIAIRLTAQAIDDRIEQIQRHLAGLGISQISARLNDGFVSIRARAADGLAAADLSFRIHFVSAGTQLRALGSTIRVHGHLPTPGPVMADRILVALLGATDAAGVVERPHVRGLCDVEIDLVGALLWHMLPPAGWRLPAVGDLELVRIAIGRNAVEAVYGPAGTRTGELGVRPQTHQLAAGHDLMHSADAQLRDGHFEEAMRGYRALLAAGGPEQPLLLERILAVASARPAWFFDGLELSRQALGRWPSFPPSHAALASITLAQGDARVAAEHLTHLAQLASADGDDDQTALAALAGARLLRVLDPKAATQLYQLALEHDPGSTEAADALADRFADEQRWPELVRLVRARAVITPELSRAVQLRLRLADVFVHHLDDPASAQQELAVARHLAPDDPAVHEMTATILATIDPIAAVSAWRDVARLAEARGDHRTTARALAIVGDKLVAADPDGRSAEAERAWHRALELDPLQADAITGLANAAAMRADHAVAAELYERLRGLGLPQQVAARHELSLARSLVAVGRTDDARASLRRATTAGGETAAEAHAVLAEVAEAANDRDHAANELDTAIAQLLELANDAGGERMYTRAAELAMARAALFDRAGQASAASSEWARAHELAMRHAPQIARSAARTLLDRSASSTEPHHERQWIDAVLATRPPAHERAQLLVRRAAVRRDERTPDMAAALADLHEALRICEQMASNQDGTDPEATEIRKRAYQLEAELLAKSGDQRARAQALAALAKMAVREDRAEVETAAAAAWLAADEPAAALPHGARAHAALEPEVPARLRREVLTTLGEAAWRQRAWPDVLRAYRGLVDDPDADVPRAGVYRYRLAVSADRTGDPALALEALRPLVEDPEAAHGATPELRGQALRLYAELAERSGDLSGAATALEGFAALAVDSSATARADAMYRAGELFRRADRADDAIRCLESALRISETHLPALDALEMAWRERGDNERVSVILGRKVAATTRHPARQKPLLSRLGDLQDQLGRPDVALATHQRALEIDPTWRPSLRYVTLRLRDSGQLVAAAGGLAQLAGELPGDTGVDLAIVARERTVAATALAALVVSLDGSQLEAVGDVARPALERAGADGVDVASALARIRGEIVHLTTIQTFAAEENTASGRSSSPSIGALSLKDAAQRARLAGKLDDALATLEAANHVNPGDTGVLQELVELATELGDHVAAARHLSALADLIAGARKGNVLLELAEVYYDHLDDPGRGRTAMRAAAEAFGKGSRRDATLRMLASEARANLAWDVAVEALEGLDTTRRTGIDLTDLANALVRAGRDGAALALVEDPEAAAKLDDGGELAATLRAGRARKLDLATSLEAQAQTAPSTDDAEELLDEAAALRAAADPRTKTLPGVGEDGDTETTPPRTKTKPGHGDGAPAPAGTLGRIKLVSVPRTQSARPAIIETGPAVADTEDGFVSVTDPRIKSGPIAVPIEMASAPVRMEDAPDESLPDDAPAPRPLVVVRPPAVLVEDDAAQPLLVVRPPAILVEDEASPDTTLRDMAAQHDGLDDGARKPPTLPPAQTLRKPAAPSIPPRTTLIESPANAGRAAPPEAVRRSIDAAVPPPVPEISERSARRSSPTTIAPPTPTGDRPRGPSVPPPVAGRRAATTPPTVGGLPPVPAPAGARLPPTLPPPIAPEPATTLREYPTTPPPPAGRRPTYRDVPTVPPPLAQTGERERLLSAHRAAPDDAATLTALLANLADAPALRREVLEAAQRASHGPALAIVLFELALLAREDHDLIRAAALLSRAHEVDGTLAPVWMPLADTLAASDEIDAARELYERVAESTAYDERRRAFARDRAEVLGKDDSIVSGEITPRPRPVQRRSSLVNLELDRARKLADVDDIKGAIAIAEQIATANNDDVAALELLEQLYLRSGDITGASEAIGRHLLVLDDELAKAALWRRRAKLYRDSLNRDAEAYRCLKEAHACAPADPEIAYQLRTAAMVRGEWALVASLLYREIAAAAEPRERGALHLELALVFDERLDDDAQAQVNFEQALALDPTIPAAKLPLARRYETLGRLAEAALLYEQAAASARAADRAALYEAAARCLGAAKAAAAPPAPDLPALLERALSAGDGDTALDLAHQIWRAEPGHAAAFRVLANAHRTSGDLAALSDITSVRASRAENPEERAAAWLGVARLAEEVSALDQAARAYDLALVEDPGNMEALDARGALAFRLDDFSTADSIYRDLTPSETLLGIDELALRRSVISERLGRDSEALTLAQTAAEAAPSRRDLIMRVQELATRIGELDTALSAARTVVDLVPLDDEETKLRAYFALVELLREAGDLDGAIAQLERILRDYPIHARALETLAEIHTARGDWATATRILYQLVPLAPTSQQRAERLYRLGEAVLVHLGDIDRADDVFLRASDLDPSHVPTLRRLLDVYWRADDPGALVEVATELAERGALANGPTAEQSLAHALVAAALIGDTQLAARLGTALGDDGPRWIATALGELVHREGRLQLSSASTAIAELARRGMLDLAKVRAAAAAPVATLLATS